MPAWQLVLAAAGLAAYALVSHWLTVNAAAQPWALAALFGPLLLAAAGGGWMRRHGPTLAWCAAAVAGLVAVVWRGGVRDVNRMLVLQHAGIHLALAWSFAITLRPGASALIEALAERVHPVFPPAMRAYTRGLTRLWVGYFLGMVVLSLAIYALAPWPWWSLFANLITPLAVAVMFVGEHGLRRWLHPEFERATLRGAIHAWREFNRGAAR